MCASASPHAGRGGGGASVANSSIACLSSASALSMPPPNEPGVLNAPIPRMTRTRGLAGPDLERTVRQRGRLRAESNAGDHLHACRGDLHAVDGGEERIRLRKCRFLDEHFELIARAVEVRTRLAGSVAAENERAGAIEAIRVVVMQQAFAARWRSRSSSRSTLPAPARRRRSSSPARGGRPSPWPTRCRCEGSR